MQPGTEVPARDLRWEVVATESLGAQTLYRLRCIQAALIVQELDLLHPFEPVEAVCRELRMEIIDRDLLETVRKANELGANPFDSIPLGLVLIDFLKQEWRAATCR